MLKTLVLTLVLACGAFAQQLPDAPQPKTEPRFADLTVHNSPSTFKEEGRGKKKLLVLAGVEAFAIGANIYDVRASERAFKLGYIESNGFLLCPDREAGQVNTCRPSARALYTRDIAFELAIATVPSVLGYVFKRPEFFYGLMSAPAMVGIKHLQGGYKASHLR